MDLDIGNDSPGSAGTKRQASSWQKSFAYRVFNTLLGIATAIGLVSSGVACGQVVYEDERPEPNAPDEDCVIVPQFHEDTVPRYISREEANSGCREFGVNGCTECCLPSTGWNGEADCLVLGATGERVTGSPCDASCPPCARCSVKDERTLYELAPSLECDCSILGGKLGFDPDVPCERDCYTLRSAVWNCPHKVCLN